MVFFDSSVLVTVPSDDRVTVFSFDFTVPSLLTLVLFVWEISWAHPTSRKDNINEAVAAKVPATRFFIVGGQLFFILQTGAFVKSGLWGTTRAVNVSERACAPHQSAPPGR